MIDWLHNEVMRIYVPMPVFMLLGIIIILMVNTRFIFVVLVSKNAFSKIDEKQQIVRKITMKIEIR